MQPESNTRPHVTVPSLRAMKQRGEKIAVVTAYDASFAAAAETAGIDVVLVGDSLGMVVQGNDSTLPVTVDGGYGPNTTNGVSFFQAAHHLPVTGAVDLNTAMALRAFN